MQFRQWIMAEVDFSNPDGFSSMRLFTEVAALSPNIQSRLQTGVGWIAKHQIPCCLVGGAAVLHYVAGSRPLTPDLDFLVPDITIVVQKAQQDGLAMARLNGTLSPPVTGITIEEFSIDFIDAKTGNVKLNRYILSTAKPTMVGGATIQVISPAVLTVMKLSLGRDKDDNDAFLLLQSGTFTKQEFKKALQDLRGAIEDPASMWSYSYMIP